MDSMVTARPATAISVTAARLSFLAAAVFVVLLAALHFIKPELDPSWHFISEYAIGGFGWLMELAFFALALGCIMLSIAIRSQIRTVAGWIGLFLLMVNAVGLIMAGMFTTDPITASPGAMTREGSLHNLGGTLGISMPFAIAFISWSLARNPVWFAARRSIIMAAVLAWIGFLVSFLSLGFLLSQSGGQFGPGVLVGWPNRFEVLAYCVWILVAAGQAARMSKLNSEQAII